MTTYNNFGSRNRDNQDGIERHLWGKLTYEDSSGSYIEVKGTGTTDYDVGVINVGYSFNIPDNSNAEVFVVTDGSDTNQKYAFLTLPRDKQRQWKANTGGVQNPLDPNKALEFNPKRTHLRDNNIAFGDNGIFEVVGDKIIIRGSLQIKGDLIVGGKIEAKGNILSEGSAIFNGSLSTSHLKTPHSSTDNDTTTVRSDVSNFEDYND